MTEERINTIIATVTNDPLFVLSINSLGTQWEQEFYYMLCLFMAVSNSFYN